MTPTDAYSFVGDPPLWRPPADEVHVSVTFTWDVEEGYRLRDAWAEHYEVVKIGGPAIKDCDRVGEFVPGRYVKHGVTITSRGCIRRCPWCLVPESEGDLKLLDIKPGWIVQDNNLLACPRAHQEQVYAMLKTQGRKVSFPGGLDARLVDDWVADQLRQLPIKEVFLAADTWAALESLKNAVRKLDFLNRRQLRCYVLIGRDEIGSDIARLCAVWRIGCLPFAQLYQPADRWLDYPSEWKKLVRKWSRPAAMFASMGGRP